MSEREEILVGNGLSEMGQREWRFRGGEKVVEAISFDLRSPSS